MAYDGGQYRGPTRNGRPHGHGVVTWPDGKRYEGGFVNGERTGHGVYSLLSGDYYEGDFVNGRFHGRGVMIYEGRRYEGGWRDNRQHGRGVYTWPNGYRYEGDFRDGKEHGHGIYTWPSGRRYEGEFLDGEITGRGVYSSVDVETHIEEQARQHNNEDARHGSQAQNREYWGAFVSTIGLHRPAYGISWNYPSKEDALNRAARECGERAGYENGVCDIASELDDKFSTFAPYEDDYNFRMRCYAVALYTSAQDQTGFYAGAAGNSESDAMARVGADSVLWGYSANIAQVVCNAK